MKRRLKEPFGKAGLTVAVVALVFAMLGGAYAASSNGGGKATASAKAKQGKQGKPGKTGLAGPAGPAGPAGAKGDTGAAGSNGGAGADGKSVTGEPIASGGACGTGVTGVKYTLNATSTNVCNGKNGTPGPPGAPGDPGPAGSPWTAGGTLPSGSTETGSWLGTTNAAEKGNFVLTFPIPLAAPITTFLKTKVLRQGGISASAEGTWTSGSSQITGITGQQGLFEIGTVVTGAGIPAGTTITACTPGCFGLPSELTLSENATEDQTGVPFSAGVYPECDDGQGAAPSAGHPEADSGFICVFVGLEEGAPSGFFAYGIKQTAVGGSLGASTAGAMIEISAGSGGGVEKFYSGTFAVTG
jgi:hypothetical protein